MAFGKRKTFIEVDAFDLNELVKKHYGDIGYDFIDAAECGNDTEHTFTVKAESNERKWKQMMTEKRFSNSAVLNRLCLDGHIERGEYVIKVCW